MKPIHALFGAALLGAVVMPIAVAGAKDPQASASAKNPTKQIKALSRRVAALESKPAPAVPAPAIPTTLPPSGPAGGDLIGSFPNPQIGPNTIGSPQIASGAVGKAELGNVITVQAGPFPVVAGGDRVGASAICPDGSRLLSGGVEWQFVENAGTRVIQSQPSPDPTTNPSWGASVRVDAGGANNQVTIDAVCLT
jgi:hypothetical protein